MHTYMIYLYKYTCIYISWSTHIGKYVGICQKAVNKMETSCAK